MNRHARGIHRADCRGFYLPFARLQLLYHECNTIITSIMCSPMSCSIGAVANIVEPQSPNCMEQSKTLTLDSTMTAALAFGIAWAMR